jgi:hypothetical protein
VKILIAYPQIRNANYPELMVDLFGPDGRPNIMIDSGAFSVFRGTVKMSIEEYADWLSRWHSMMDVYVNFDVIGDAQGSMRNFEYLKGRGLTPMPVIHPGSPWSYLDRYVEMSPWIGLGGWAVGNGRAHWPAWAAQVFKRYPEHHFHGFGMTDVDLMLAFPWYSVDSASWLAGWKYGRMLLWNGRRMIHVGVGGLASRPGGIARSRAAQELVRGYGADPHSLYGDSYRYTTVARISIRAWEMMEEDLRKTGRDFRAYVVGNLGAIRAAWEAVNERSS